MNIADIIKEIITFAGTYNPLLIICLFVLLLLNEFGFFIPCLLETIWIIVGYNLHVGSISVYQAVALMAASMAGHLTGSLILYNLSKLGSPWILKVYHRFINSSTTSTFAKSNSLPVRILKKANLLSPYPVALGRLLWMKIPLTLTLGVRKNLRTLMLAVMLSSFVSDSTICTLGFIGGSMKLNPLQTIFYSMAGIFLIYTVIFILKKVYSLSIANFSDQKQ